jgi:hypothetical protein
VSKHLTIDGLLGELIRITQPNRLKPHKGDSLSASWRIVAYDPKDGLVTLRSTIAGQRDIVPWVWLRYQLREGHLVVV